MATIKIGVDTSSIGLPLRHAILLAGQLGLDAIEIDARGEFAPSRVSRTAIRELRKTLEDQRLRVSAVAFRTRRGYDTTADLEPRIAATKAAMEFAYQLGTNIVVNHIGRIPESDDSPNWPLLVETLTELGRYGQQSGAMLAAETGPDDADAWNRLLEALPEASILLDFNAGNLLASGYSAIEFAEQLGGHVGHVHATDGICDPVRRSGELVSLGHGAADFPAILGTLGEHGYHGYYTLQASSAPVDPAELAEAAKFLRGL